MNPAQSPAVATHTPTPWYDESTNRPSANIVSADHVIAYVYDRNDRAFIVRACNSHAQLVAALEDLLRNATDKERYISILEGTDVEASEQADELLDSPEMKRARATLQAAKE